jgi:hypothetical protein
MPQKALKMSREVDECKPLLRGRARTALHQYRGAGEDLKAALALQEKKIHAVPAAAGIEEDSGPGPAAVGRCRLTLSNPS